VTVISVAHLRVRVPIEQRTALRSLARHRHASMSDVLRDALARELRDADSSSLPDESAIREMAILIAVELVLKLQEASMPGGVTLSRRLVEDAARAAVNRIELVESRLREASSR
jgi:hypothetical protein